MCFVGTRLDLMVSLTRLPGPCWGQAAKDAKKKEAKDIEKKEKRRGY